MTDFGPRPPFREDPQPARRPSPGPVVQTTVERRTDPWTLVMGILGGVLLGTGVTFAVLGFTGVFEEPTPPTLPPPPVLTVPPPTGPPPTFGDTITATGVAERVIPSTVFIEASTFLSAGSGSGVIYGEDGYIITNDHVAGGAGDLFVIFSDGSRFPAELIGADPVTDVAVLRVDRADLTPIEVGSSQFLSIGEPAVAVGNPLGLEGGPTVTSGIISALDRSLTVTPGQTLYGLVQTDAPIAPGSSGGALVDARGRLIGITTAIAVSDVGAEGLGFAIPVDLAIGVANDLIRDGRVRHARLGISGDTVWAEQNGAEFPVGVGIGNVEPGSSYDLAGGQVNDVITELAGNPVNTIDELLSTLRGLRAGDVVQARILRSNDQLVVDIELEELNP